MEITEAVVRRCSAKKVFLQISQNSQESKCEFCQISKNTFLYFFVVSAIFAKTFILDVLLSSECVSNYCIWKSPCLLYYFFHFESIKFRSSHSQISFKIKVFKKFAIFAGKHLCWSLFVIRLAVHKPGNLLKRDANTSVFLLILLNV